MLEKNHVLETPKRTSSLEINCLVIATDTSIPLGLKANI